MQPVNFLQAYPEHLKGSHLPNTGDMPIAIARDPATLAEVKPGDPRPVAIISCWRLSDEELQEVQRTGVIYVGVMASEDYRTQPPIYAMGLNPFEHHDFKRVPRTLILERVDDVRNAMVTQSHIDNMGTRHELEDWKKLMGEVSVGNIEGFIREVFSDDGIPDIFQIFKSLVHMVHQDDGREIVNASERLIPPMLEDFIRDVLTRMRNE